MHEWDSENARIPLSLLQEEVVRKWDKWLEGPRGNGSMPYFRGLHVWTGATP